ncbi:acidic repeat-containing protein-like [Nasonia vitripennis]|uniref:Uncharacterized protein n=1 Tax=Nasonia vitripennis TaxID=7425 RepID=A0A7M7QLW7_NASVI|nr:acidic repeat-containing protein-like [Nasonia vitripennis]
MNLANNLEVRKERPSRVTIYRRIGNAENMRELLNNNEVTDDTETSHSISSSNHDQVDARDDIIHRSSSVSSLQHENADDHRIDDNRHEDNIPRMSPSLSSEQNSWIDEDSEEFFGTDIEDDINDDGDIFHDSDDNNYDWVNNFEADDIPEEITFEKLRNLCNSDEGNAKIEGLVVSKVEILIAVLKFGLVNKLCQTAIADLFKMINCFMGKRLLPEIRYFIDQFFNTQSGIEFHSVCPHCKRYIKKFIVRQIA